MKVIIRVSQGLANRMFQVAFALSMREKYDVKVDCVRKIKFAHEDVDMFRIFRNLNIKEASHREIKSLGGEDTFFYKVIRRLPFVSSTVIYPFDQPFMPHKLNIKHDSYFIGTFQSELFFANVKDNVRKAFEFPKLEDEKNIAFAESLNAENSVAIHVRKGNDYKKDILLNTCKVVYYMKAIQYIKDHVENPRFYVFTDNQQWVKDNFKDFEYKIVDWNPITGSKSYIDMQLMSFAKHNIIANSTFSWWGAWLNDNKDKIVIAPQHWYNPNMDNLQNLGIVPNNWIKI